jgi:L-arabinokinase
VPQGKGVSSSAALEVATMQAMCALYDIHLEGREMALLCQRVENVVVGAPCGVMDQMTAACGEWGSLLALLCQPAEIQTPVPLPSDIEVWGIDSGIRHAITGADYRSVRTGAFMGYRILAEQEGLPTLSNAKGHVLIDDSLWQGYLANITPSSWEKHYRHYVPETLDGATFLKRYEGIPDTVTDVEPTRVYSIRHPTAHPIYEHHRVRQFRALLLQAVLHEKHLALLGELMYQSHESYSACGLGSSGTDRIVALVRETGTQNGLYGAKITGGGSGGTIAVLAKRDAEEAIARVVAQYEAETGLSITVFRGSSSGASAWGWVRLQKE